MRGGTTFADVLEHTLGAFQPDTPLSGTSPSFRQAPPPFLLFGPRRFHFQSTPYAALRDQPRAARPERLWRALTPAQQHALDGLIRLGASLQPDFTTRELRTVFRRLARRYHPDGHPGSSDAEKARLARTFSEVDRCYKLLREAQPA
jgi:DnaJ-like protein